MRLQREDSGLEGLRSLLGGIDEHDRLDEIGDAQREVRRDLFLLLGGADDDLVHGDSAGPCDDIRHGVRDVVRLEPLDTAACAAPSLYSGAQMATELGSCRAGLDHRDAHMSLGNLLAQ
jgi:hypothetical protein